MTSRRVILIAGVLLAAALLWRLWPDERRAIRSRVEHLVDVANADAATDLEHAARIASLATALAPDIVISLDGTGQLRGRDAVIAAAQGVRRSRHARVVLDALDVSVDTATTATAIATLRLDDEPDGHVAQLGFVKQGGGWLLATAGLARPLTRPRVEER